MHGPCMLPGPTYTAYPVPIIRNVAPRGGPDVGRTLVTLSGTNFGIPLGTAQLMCRFGERRSPAIFIPPQEVVCFSPSQPAGPNVVYLSLNDVDWHVFVIKYTYYVQAVIDSLDPQVNCPQP